LIGALVFKASDKGTRRRGDKGKADFGFRILDLGHCWEGEDKVKVEVKVVGRR